MQYKGKPTYRIVVPTRNSASWARTFLRAYKKLQVEPLYLVDSRTTDDTADILADEHVEFKYVTPDKDRVEAIMAKIPTLCQSDWVLRLDDDELPSATLVKWLDSALPQVEENAVSICRRTCLLSRDGLMRYSRAEMLYWDETHPEFLDPQIRLFRPNRVSYKDEIHTPGLIPNSPVYRAPCSAFFAHFDWIIRTAAERINKIRAYDKQVPGTLKYAKFYLAECLSPERLRETDFDTDEFNEVAEGLRALRLSRLLSHQR